jgi:hypothetical protein
MQRKTLCGVFLVLIFALTMGLKPASAADTLAPNDFKSESFSKTVDFFDFARQYAENLGKPKPPDNLHAYLYQVYVNVSGFQLFYSGLSNITTDQGAFLTIPVQSFLEHYKTPNGKDVLTSSSFIMLLAFNDTDISRYPDSPDVNDNLYASFSLGFDLSGLGAKRPALNSKTSIIPLNHTDDTWSWGMKYTNLTAIWWRMHIGSAPDYDRKPIAITIYDELTFTYTLVINPANHTANLTASYVIGRMTNLWLTPYWLLFIPIGVTHFNSTGAYYPNGTQIQNGPTIYQFLESQQIKMSIVLFQNSLVLKHATESKFSNQTATDVDVGNDAEVEVSDGEISTEAGNEKIFKTDFGTKKQYKLYNYTAGNTEATYNARTRTVPRLGFASNPLFSVHVALLKYVPLIVAHIDPPLYQQAKDHMLNMTYADYFYLISYPKYSGFKVEHDPTYTAYIAESNEETTTPMRWGGILLLGVGVAAVAVIVVFVVKRRSPKPLAIPQSPTT